MALTDTYLTGFIKNEDYSDRLDVVNTALLNVNSPISQVTSSNFTFKGIKTFLNGIKFANETLNDYWEATWTVIDASGDATPRVASSTVARYVRIGNVVYFNADATYSSNTSSTNAQLSGPPHTVVGSNRTCHIWTSLSTFGAYGELVPNGARTDIRLWRRIPADLPNHQRVTNGDLSSKTVRYFGMFLANPS
jgi:hypothetical protein